MARRPRGRSITGARPQPQRRGPPPAEFERIAGLIGQKLHDAALNDLLRLQAAFPNHADIENLLGVVHYQSGRLQEAANAYAKAVRAAPSHPLLAFNKGKVEFDLGAFEKAANSFKKALKLKPDFAEAHAALGDVHARCGRLKMAAESYRGALDLNPAQPSALMGLGLLRLSDGAAAEAAALFETLLTALPQEAEAARAASHANLGLALDRCGRKKEALAALFEAVALAPEEARYRSALAQSLRHVRDAPEGERAERALALLVVDRTINPRNLATALQACLRRRHALEPIFAAQTSDPDADPEHSGEDQARLDALFADPLFLAFLSGAPITDAEFEILLTAARKRLLLAAAKEEAPPLEFATALAGQCWANEYAFYVTEAEIAALQDLRAALAARPLADYDADDWARLALASAYAPMPDFGVEDALPDGAPDLIGAIHREQVAEPQREAEIRAAIQTIGSSAGGEGDAVSAAVEKQYAENPYPRWSRCDLTPPVPLAEALRAELPHLPVSELPDIAAPRVLIAGCGTGLQTMKAFCAYKGASFLAVDLSRPSLAYGMRKLEGYGVESVQHRQANILDLGALEERFDLIESYGVIHHMEDPAAALGVLAERLKPGGFIYLGLYSELGRQSVVEARRAIAERGYPHDAAGIRQARRDIMRERDERLAPLLSPASDFWTLSDTRDLIFHVQEHRLTLPQIGEMLSAKGLEFLGLAPPSFADRLAFEAERGGPEAARDIAQWHQFELAHPEVFGDTYKIWARKPV